MGFQDIEAYIGGNQELHVSRAQQRAQQARLEIREKSLAPKPRKKAKKKKKTA